MTKLNERESAMLIIRAELLTGALEEYSRTKAHYLELRDSKPDAININELDSINMQLMDTRKHLKNNWENVVQQRVNMRELLQEIEANVKARKLRESREAGSEANSPFSNYKGSSSLVSKQDIDGPY